MSTDSSGRVLNMETRSTVAESSKLDPEGGVWRECQNYQYVNYIRIFFEIGRGTVTSIGKINKQFSALFCRVRFRDCLHITFFRPF